VKILVTGAMGQVGAELIQQGPNRGYEMLATDIEDLDITNQEAVNAYVAEHKPNLIINAAAYTAVDKAESESELAFSINCDGAKHLAIACNEANIPLFHISTDYVFDGAKDEAYSESDIPNPQSVYGKSKLKGDLAIEAALEEHLILRTSWVFSDRGRNFVKTMLRLGSEQEELRIVSDQRGCPTEAASIAQVLLNLVHRLNEGEHFAWGTYHYCGQPPTAWQHFAEAIFEQAEKLALIQHQPSIHPITTDEFHAAAPRPKNASLNCSKITNELGITPPDWRVGLENTLKRIKDQ
jgi:dTDP-4-dehydrorhamnose reductase